MRVDLIYRPSGDVREKARRRLFSISVACLALAALQFPCLTASAQTATPTPALATPTPLPADCNMNGTDDALDISTGTSADCNANGVPDECEIPHFSLLSPVLGPLIGTPFSPQSLLITAPPPAAGSVEITLGSQSLVNSAARYIDVDLNGIPVGRAFGTFGPPCVLQNDSIDVPAADWNAALALGAGDITINMIASPGVLDLCSNSIQVGVSYTASDGSSADCNGNGIPDDCETDCNGNGVPDDCDIAAGTSADCNANGVPDECDIATGGAADCDSDGVPDACELAAGTEQDCNGNGVPDACDIAAAPSSDCNGNMIPDSCETADLRPPEGIDFGSRDVNAGPGAEMNARLINEGSVPFPLAGEGIVIQGTGAADFRIVSVEHVFPDLFREPLFGSTVTSDIVYTTAPAGIGGGMRELRLDLYEPTGGVYTGPRPFVVYVHGGSFYSGSKTSSNAVDFGHGMAQCGYVVASIEYRLIGDFPPDQLPGYYDDSALALSICVLTGSCPPSPGALEDIKSGVAAAIRDTRAAVEWARANEETLNLTTDLIGLAGFSAGAITSLLAGYDQDFGAQGVGAIIDRSGSMLGNDNLIEAGEAGVFVHHGTQDFVVSISGAHAVRDRALAVGVPLEYREFIGGHSAISLSTVVSGKTVQQRYAKFLYDNLGLEAVAQPPAALTDPVPVGMRKRVWMDFDPSAPGARSAQLVALRGCAGPDLSIPLTGVGTGMTPSATPTLPPTPTPAATPTSTAVAQGTPSPTAASTATTTPDATSGATPTPDVSPTPEVTPTPEITPTPVCCPGDADNSGGSVNANDFLAVQANFGADHGAGGLGDADCSGGAVNANDFLAVQANFGADCG